MHEMIVNLGYTVADFFMKLPGMLRADYLMGALPIMGVGMLGIFVVTIVIICVVTLISKLFQDKD